MSHLRKRVGMFYAYPEHVKGIRGVVKRAWWQLGFDPLTIRQRLVQVDIEREYWKGLVEASE